jgi:hypothetical protein
MDDLAT